MGLCVGGVFLCVVADGSMWGGCWGSGVFLFGGRWVAKKAWLFVEEGCVSLLGGVLGGAGLSLEFAGFSGGEGGGVCSRCFCFEGLYGNEPLLRYPEVVCLFFLGAVEVSPVG